MTRHRPSTLSLILLITVLLFACQQEVPPFVCTDAIGCVDVAPGEPLKLGVLAIAFMNNEGTWMVVLAFGSIVAGTSLLLETT